MKRGIFQTLFGSGWVIGAMGLYVLSLGIVFAASTRVNLGTLAVMSLGLLLLILGTAAVVTGRRALRSRSNV